VRVEWFVLVSKSALLLRMGRARSGFQAGDFYFSSGISRAKAQGEQYVTL
jgi:hypothetical protein